jgi:hypothetical protein
MGRTTVDSESQFHDRYHPGWAPKTNNTSINHTTGREMLDRKPKNTFGSITYPFISDKDM